MQDYQIAAPATSAADWQAYLDYANDMERFPRDPRTPCANADCARLCESLYCSEPCRVCVEGLDVDEDNYYSDGEGCLLGERTIADTQYAADQAAGGFAAMVCGYVPPAAPATPAPLPEAPCSVHVRVSVHGYDCQVTLRDYDEATLLRRLETLLARYPAETPAPPAPSTPQCPTHGAMKPSTKGTG
jgi:hypothetical protein